MNWGREWRVVQVKELQVSNVQLRHQLTVIESASNQAWRCLQHFQQRCQDACNQNDALRSEVQRLKQKQAEEQLKRRSGCVDNQCLSPHICTRQSLTASISPTFS